MKPRSPKRTATPLPRWIEPQLAKLVTAAPDGDSWLHEIKLDGYRLHARIDQDRATLLTRAGLDWTNTYPGVAAGAGALRVRQAYLDGEICALDPNGVSSFARMQAGDAALVYFAFDLLHLDGKSMLGEPLIDRKARLAELLARVPAGAIRYSDHQVGQGPAFLDRACAAGVEGIVSKRADGHYHPGTRHDWLKVKCLNREEFVIVGWTDPERAAPAPA